MLFMAHSFPGAKLRSILGILEDSRRLTIMHFSYTQSSEIRGNMPPFGVHVPPSAIFSCRFSLSIQP
jgi:hypothetical protein